MSGDRWADEFEREAAEEYKERRAKLREFADEVESFAFNQLGIWANIRKFRTQEKILIMEQFHKDGGTSRLDIWLATERYKEDFFYDALEFLEYVEPRFSVPGSEPKEDPGSFEYREKLRKFTEELEFYCLDFMPDERKFDTKTDFGKLAIMHRFNERVGLKNVGIWVEDEDRFFENYLDFIKEDWAKKKRGC